MLHTQYQKVNKEAGNEWFTIESNKTGTRWTGKVWYVHDLLRYEFDLEFELPVSYPDVAPELALPELDGKTVKMYRGGKICLDSHFRPLWARNVPHFGIAHAMALGVSTSSCVCVSLSRSLPQRTCAVGTTFTPPHLLIRYRPPHRLALLVRRWDHGSQSRSRASSASASSSTKTRRPPNENIPCLCSTV